MKWELGRKKSEFLLPQPLINKRRVCAHWQAVVFELSEDPPKISVGYLPWHSNWKGRFCTALPATPTSSFGSSGRKDGSGEVKALLTFSINTKQKGEAMQRARPERENEKKKNRRTATPRCTSIYS